MQFLQSISEMQSLAAGWRQEGVTIGFVPTMGNLHAGHLSLVEKARSVAHRVVVSVFVNPLQFNQSQDFAAYPRTLQADREKLAGCGVDAVFAPTEAEMYPRGREAVTVVDVPQLSEDLEGACRPGHFRGMATVVAKLFHIVQPDVAVFGEKDFQQLLIVRRMVADLNMPLEIIGMPTRREPDGLAMSSRNNHLTAAERKIAPGLYQVLQDVKQRIREGEQDYASLEKRAMAELQAAGFEPEYVAVRRPEDLQPPGADDEVVLLAAARLGKTRLIDNLRV